MPCISVTSELHRMRQMTHLFLTIGECGCCVSIALSASYDCFTVSKGPVGTQETGMPQSRNNPLTVMAGRAAIIRVLLSFLSVLLLCRFLCIAGCALEYVQSDVLPLA